MWGVTSETISPSVRSTSRKHAVRTGMLRPHVDQHFIRADVEFDDLLFFHVRSHGLVRVGSIELCDLEKRGRESFSASGPPRASHQRALALFPAARCVTQRARIPWYSSGIS